MNKGVDRIDFWKKRIDTAPKDKEHFSVYVTTNKNWDKIEIEHSKIIKKECIGKTLDAGCGYGRLAPLIDEYVGVDFSSDFIDIAKKKYPNKTFVVGDLISLPFKDNEFDCAVCSSIKQMIIGNLGIDVWNSMEKELLRVARKLVILEYPQPEIYDVLRSTHN